MVNSDNISRQEFKYLELLSSKFPTVSDACMEIINLEAILDLPKGTEHFLSDIHGEDEAFIHIVSNASGVIKRKIEENFGESLDDITKKEIATLIYYPQEKIDFLKQEYGNIEKRLALRIEQLSQLLKYVCSKYTRSKVRKALPHKYAYIIEELISEKESGIDKEKYYTNIINTIVDLGQADKIVKALAEVIKKLAIDRLHIIGDIFDRGPGAEKIMDFLINYRNVDIQWGNHDIIWMGAAAGSMACAANVLRIALRYNNLETIQNGYGINIYPLIKFAEEFYTGESNKKFTPRESENLSSDEILLITKMHKAISVIQFKLEGKIILSRPEFNMDDRLLLHKINFENKTITIAGTTFEMNDNYFPTIDKDEPYELSPDERACMKQLIKNFMSSEKLQRHVEFLYKNGSMYLAKNNNLVFHGSIPLTSDKEFAPFIINGNEFSGRELLDEFDQVCRKAYFEKYDVDLKKLSRDYLWYLWCGPVSPLFGKDKMATFERYFIDNKSTHEERKQPYYRFNNKSEVMIKILEEFNLDPDKSKIINGHVPVKVKKGELPVKADGKLIVIDGGFSKAYQDVTGIAGYTLIHNSYGLQLVAHEPFISSHDTIITGKDVKSDVTFIEKNDKRMRIRDTDTGRNLSAQVEDLRKLVKVYKDGLLKEK
ncbi:MAG: fructose-1,6-bisphosphatase [Candidatus Delongbacteria bacterium]|nr:fructose-1,6-bisphosphatase [Candidatus Delongbacteria bacterium]MBN2836884.1 fructose-1,6-bisphosphatase [Candidatus Delongbacteria bacterium]